MNGGVQEVGFTTVMLYIALGCLALFAFISDKRATALENRIIKMEKQWDEWYHDAEIIESEQE